MLVLVLGGVAAYRISTGGTEATLQVNGPPSFDQADAEHLDQGVPWCTVPGDLSPDVDREEVTKAAEEQLKKMEELKSSEFVVAPDMRIELHRAASGELVAVQHVSKLGMEPPPDSVSVELDDGSLVVGLGPSASDARDAAVAVAEDIAKISRGESDSRAVTPESVLDATNNALLYSLMFSTEFGDVLLELRSAPPAYEAFVELTDNPGELPGLKSADGPVLVSRQEKLARAVWRLDSADLVLSVEGPLTDDEVAGLVGKVECS